MSLIFKKLIKDASDFVGTKINKAVITVPAYFDYSQRSAIVESARLAGIEVLRIINEPTAAALAYGLGTKENLSDSLALSIIKKDNISHRTVLVFDLGGGTFDITILVLENFEFNVKASLGDTHLGGIDFDNKLVDYCLKNFCIKMNIKEDDIRKDIPALKRLKNQCEKAKKRLTKYLSEKITVTNFFNNMNLMVEITRDRFNKECEKLYKKIEVIINKIINLSI
jgi:molecular chaperone DnaK (HSP70)